VRPAVLLLCCTTLHAITLAELESMALRAHPSLEQANAGVRSAQALRRQAGAYPNPTVGYNGDEINRGAVFNYGEHGVFVEQRFVTGGKLGIARKIAEQNIAQSEAERGAQRQRVLNTVRSLYYQALGEQRLLQVRTELAAIARRTVQTTRELQNIGQADRPDLLAVDIEAQRLELGLVTGKNALDRTWRQLAAATGNPGLQPTTLEGNIEELPKIAFDDALAKLLADSPEIKIAETITSRSTLAVDQARKAVVPDISARAGAHYNRERLEVNNRQIGWQATAEVGVELPIFNRNQGNIAAARADAERARFAVERTRLNLRSRLAAAFREYQDAVAASERYRSEMIPKAQEAYELYQRNFRQMATAYPNVLMTQRNLFQLQEDYAQTLVTAWQRAVEIQGLLLMDGQE
jgi:cobalt-zinc-cadmium efflux system outer membrane protein